MIPHPQDAPSSTLPATLHDPKSLFYQKVGLRRAIIASYWTVILLAIPLWWYTTSIERLALPSGRVQQIAQNRLELPIPICIEGEDIPRIDRIQVQFSARIAQDPQRWKGLAPKLLGSTSCGMLSLSYHGAEALNSIRTNQWKRCLLSSFQGGWRRVHKPSTTSSSSQRYVITHCLIAYYSYVDLSFPFQCSRYTSLPPRSLLQLK